MLKDKVFSENMAQHNVQDKFDANNCHSTYQIQGNGCRVQKNETRADGCVFFTNKVKSGVHSWKFKLIHCGSDDLTIGIWKTKNKLDTSKTILGTGKGKVYGWICGYYAKRTCGYFHDEPQSDYKYGSVVSTGDTVEMILDLDNCTLRYKKNDTDLGVAFQTIEPGEYVATLSMNYNKTTVDLVSYHATQGKVNDDVKYDNNDELQSQLEEKEATINSLKDQIEGLKAKGIENEEKYKAEIDEINRRFAQSEDDKQREIKELNDIIINKDATIEKVRKENIELNEECKELKHDLEDVKAKYEELKRMNINEEEFMKWESDTITDWIVGLEDNYKKYEEVLRKNLRADEVDGSTLPEVDKNDLRGFGINIMKDRIAIIKHIKRITSNKQKEQEKLEIAAPAAAYSQSQSYQNDGPDGTNYI